VECKCICVNFRRVSDLGRALLLNFIITGVSDDCYKSTMGVIMIGLGTSRCPEKNIGCTWKHLGAPTTSLGAPGCASDKPGSSDIKPESPGN